MGKKLWGRGTVELPDALRAALEDRARSAGHIQLLHDAQAVSLRYRSGDARSGRLLTRPGEAVAYAMARMPATFAAVSAALKQSLAGYPLPVKSLLDIGAGTGAATWAARELINLESICCMEREEAMRQVGQSLMAQTGSLLARASWLAADLTAAGSDSWLEAMGGAWPFGSDRADLVIASYVLNELPAASLNLVLHKLWQATGGMLLLVEPGTPDGYARMMQARMWLLDWGARIIAPCPHQLACPLQAGDWCHFSCRVARSRLHRQLKGGDAPFEDEKFAYLAVTRSVGQPAAARILRHPRVDKGRLSLRVCQADGIHERVLHKRDGDAYRQARQAKWGDALDFETQG
jgi:ribosomal protein RSM22 (predicted rRNA methylase)